ncbi:MAG TPA: membrane protein insertion efficiency factor YidD [Patescibacteria group bacterium]|nr:membrane protein insertion efficiency factor YidD [Patescibacteria group bacterium]
MKKIFLFLISFYQNFFSYIVKNITGLNNTCRYEQTCSQYARITIEKKGVLKGLPLVITRILNCQPFQKPAFKSKNKYI